MSCIDTCNGFYHRAFRCSRQEGLDKAVKLSEDLLATVKTEWERFQQNPPPFNRGYGRGSYGHHGPPPHQGVSV
jgi:hypothetical protein